MSEDDDSIEPATAATATPTKPGKGKKWQRVVAVVLLVLGFILVPLSAIAIWTNNQLTNTDRYVETVAPLAGNDDIQETVAAVVVNAIFSNVDIEKRVASALPKRAKPLAAPIATAAQSYALDATLRPLRALDWKMLQALATGGSDPGVMIGLAFRELAENAQKIGELNISPELLRSLLSQRASAPVASAAADQPSPAAPPTKKR